MRYLPIFLLVGGCAVAPAVDPVPEVSIPVAEVEAMQIFMVKQRIAIDILKQEVIRLRTLTGCS